MSRKKKSNDTNIEKFRGIKADVNIEEIIRKNAEIAVAMLKEVSPESNMRKDARKRYSHKWSYNYYPHMEMAVVYNKKANLTYLLEHGHFIANKKGGYGRATPKPHIIKVYDAIPEEMNKIIRQTDIDFEIY